MVRSVSARPSQPIVIYGAGGHARETAWLIDEISRPDRPLHPACFVEDTPGRHGTTLIDIPIMGLQEAHARFPGAQITLAIGNSKVRAALADRATLAGFGFVSLVHPSTQGSPRNRFGEGLAVCAGSILTTHITLGRHAQINIACTISHDVTAGDFLTLAPGVHISGCVELGHRVQIGTGATFVNGTLERPLRIGDDVVIGAGACVTQDVPAGVTVVGVPARPIRRD